MVGDEEAAIVGNTGEDLDDPGVALPQFRCVRVRPLRPIDIGVDLGQGLSDQSGCVCHPQRVEPHVWVAT